MSFRETIRDIIGLARLSTGHVPESGKGESTTPIGQGLVVCLPGVDWRATFRRVDGQPDNRLAALHDKPISATYVMGFLPNWRNLRWESTEKGFTALRDVFAKDALYKVNLTFDPSKIDGETAKSEFIWWLAAAGIKQALSRSIVDLRKAQALAAVGGGDSRVFADVLEEISAEWASSDSVINQMLSDPQLADKLERGLEVTEKSGIDTDRDV